MEEFDFIVLGAGSGGLSAAIRAAKYGARVALLEPNALGGTCVNVGCVPKKAMWFAAELAEALSIAREVGFAVAPGALDWVEFVRRRGAYIDAIHESYRRRLTACNTELIVEYGRFVSSDTIVAGKRALRGRHILIATGARPRRAAMPGGDLGIVSDGFFDLSAAPKRVAILGGGYVAVELAGVLNALGSEVNVFARGDRLLPGFDREIADELAQSMAARGVRLMLDRAPIAVARDGHMHELKFADGTIERRFDELIWAIGRDPNSERLELSNAGVRVDRNGFVAADEWQDTNVAGIHAIGDVTGRVALTPVAVAAGRRLADRLFGDKPDARLDYANVPTVVFGHPPVGSVGLSEEDARSRHGDDIAVYRVRFRPMLHTLAGSSERTFMKLICVGAEERVVGIHLVGRSADEMLQGFAVALKAGATKRDFDETVAIHPTSSEEMVLMGEMHRTPVV
ncbi:MAG TPA: glutathione-disulfide reductase [Rhodanobacteraceae bacterium]|nr:glutathione-disulfide reductase [Rhodanobacteraceae bacterium]